MRSLIRGGADINRINKGGWTALTYACYVGHDNIVNMLLDDANADVNAQGLDGTTPLMWAAACGNESVTYFLLQKGCDLEIRDTAGRTALMHAVTKGHQVSAAAAQPSRPDRQLSPDKGRGRVFIIALSYICTCVCARAYAHLPPCHLRCHSSHAARPHAPLTSYRTSSGFWSKAVRSGRQQTPAPVTHRSLRRPFRDLKLSCRLCLTW